MPSCAQVSDGGPAHSRWAIVLSPDCCQRIHHGQDGDESNDRLDDQLGKIEGNVSGYGDNTLNGDFHGTSQPKATLN